MPTLISPAPPATGPGAAGLPPPAIAVSATVDRPSTALLIRLMTPPPSVRWEGNARKVALSPEVERRDLDQRAVAPSPCAATATSRAYSHSIVPGGLLVTSSTTRLIARTSLVMRVEIFARTS